MTMSLLISLIFVISFLFFEAIGASRKGSVQATRRWFILSPPRPITICGHAGMPAIILH
jgi:hypothetical protein